MLTSNKDDKKTKGPQVIPATIKIRESTGPAPR
jgi:hypothetical protein